MERNNENNVQNGEEDDDDFEDFGGFEAADPVLPNVAQPAAGLPAGVQATPNPWAVFPAGNVSMQPDLLCGQNRFPAHLDTPTTVDVASGAVASVENGEPGITSTVDRANGLFDMEHDLNNLESAELDLDQINLANDILDGSFRTSSSQSGASFMSHGREQLPDISAFDLGLSFERRTSNNNENSDVVNRTESESVHVAVRQGASREAQTISASSGAAQTVHSGRISTNENQDSSSGGDAGVARETTNESSENRSCDKSTESAEIDSLRTLMEQAESEKQAAQKELEEQLICNTKLEEDLQRSKELAESAQLQYEKLQEEHKKQLDELRQAGHQTLTVVVEEYKELLKSTVQQQQQEWNQQVVEKMREEIQRFTQLMDEQSEKFSTMQKEERQKNEDKVKEAVEEMREKEQAEFEKMLSEERQKTEDRLAEAVQKERDKSQQEIDRVIEEERKKAQQLLEEEQGSKQEVTKVVQILKMAEKHGKEKFKVKLAEEITKTQEALQEALNKERQNSRDELEKMLEEERKRSRETGQQCVTATREEMKDYLQEQRKRDKALHQRQLASLDLFLESARHQLQLLMDNNTEQNSENDNQENS